MFPWILGQDSYLLSQWLTFSTFGDSIFSSRENKVQTFFSGSIG